MRCPYCDGTVTEVDPLDENLDDQGDQIKEFECDDCGGILTQNELESDEVDDVDEDELDDWDDDAENEDEDEDEELL